MQIKITIADHDPLVINLTNSDTTKAYCEILARNLKQGDFVFRDPVKYTEEYFHELCLQVKERLGWDWIKEQYSLEQTTEMHKNIEQTLEKSHSFKNIPGDQQNLIHEAHFCIHQMQYGATDRTPFIQIEWFNDDVEPLPANADFVANPEFGDVILQNPYVGHSPIQCYQQNDFKNIDRTCQFHDVIKPGIKINTNCGLGKFNFDKYEQWWRTKCEEFVNRVGWDQILHFTGFPKVGQVIDKDNLRSIIKDSRPLNIIKIELQ